MLCSCGQNTHTMWHCTIPCGLSRLGHYYCFYPFCLFGDPAYTLANTQVNTHKRDRAARAHTHQQTCTSGFMFKVCSFFVCARLSRKVRGGGGEGGQRRSGTRESQRKRESGLSHRTTLLRAAVALPDFPLIAFSWYLNPGPFGFWRPAQTPQSPQRPIQLPDPSLTPRRG